MKVYFNEIDKYPAEWLGNLFPDAFVDHRSIKDVRAADTNEYLRCHFFAGIGGWEYALQLAGWPEDREVWTGSCPCQPFSQASNKRKGKEDERHLWPDFLRLIAERRPSVIFGEQVASPDGRRWLAGVRADMEALEYRFGAADLCAAGVGSPHNRPRLYWVANLHGGRRGKGVCRSGEGPSPDGSRTSDALVRSGSDAFVSLSDGCSERRQQVTGSAFGNEETHGRRTEGDNLSSSAGETDRAFDANNARRTSDTNIIESGDGGLQRSWSVLQPSKNPSFLQWGNTAIICADGKARRIEPSILPLAHGIPNRVGRIRAYGNAIIPQLAATFIRAFLETEQEAKR